MYWLILIITLIQDIFTSLHLIGKNVHLVCNLTNTFFSVGIFYQYDGMIFPEESPKGMRETLRAAIKKVLPSTSEGEKLSLLIHLENHKKILCSLEVTENKQTIQNVVNSVYEIYEQCWSRKICYNDCNHVTVLTDSNLHKVS